MKPFSLKIASVILIAVVMAWVISCRAADIYVPGDYTTIQQAVSAATDGDTILVADGVWSTTNLDGKAITLRSEHGNPDFCIIDGHNRYRGFVCDTDEISTTVISGFTFTRCVGYIQTSPSSSYPGDGGGIHCIASSPTITNCRFVDCSAALFRYTSPDPLGYGGAIACVDGSAPIISNCTFDECNAGEGGGAIYSDNSNPSITNCTFNDNISYGQGGALFVHGASITLSGCTFTGNQALYGDGGAVCLDGSDSSVTTCHFTQNRSVRGGAIACVESIPLIGGAAGQSNMFENNFSGAGADLFALRHPAVISAGFNNFTGLIESDYSITPLEAFDLNGSQSDAIPIRADVFVAPDGNDANDGLSANSPFQTVQYALSRILADETHPVTVHLAAGTYSSELTGEIFPLPLMSHVTISGAGPYRTILFPDDESSGLAGFHRSNTCARHLDISNGKNDKGGGIFVEGGNLDLFDVSVRNSTANAGAGIYLKDVSAQITETRISNIYPGSLGGSYGICSIDGHLVMIKSEISYCSGGIYASGDVLLANTIIRHTSFDYGGSVYHFDGHLQMVNCKVSNNSVKAVHVSSKSANETFDFINCLVTNNTGYEAALISENATGTIRHCTFSGNRIEGSSYSSTRWIDSSVTICDSILWNDADEEIYVENSDLTISFCDVQGGYPGTGNIDADPLFTAVALSDYYLADGSSGGTTSPCIDAGSAPAADCTYSGTWGDMKLDQWTSSCLWTSDDGQVDIGYHWDYPDFSGVKLDLSKTLFIEGDVFQLDAIVMNNSDSDWNQTRLWVILEVYGSFLFAPSWQSDVLDNYEIGLTTGSSIVIPIIPAFIWPDVDGQAENLLFYGAVTDESITAILGELDIVVFGYY